MGSNAAMQSAPAGGASDGRDAAFDLALAALLGRQLAARQQSEEVPFASITGYLVFVLKTLRWGSPTICLTIHRGPGTQRSVGQQP